MEKESLQKFGGDWSDAKLSALGQYLNSYTTAMKNTPFRLAYIDGFAGAGMSEVQSLNLSQEEKKFRHGSPLIALRNEPPFHTLIFIEKNKEALIALEAQIKKDPSSIGRDIRYLQGDANEKLRSLCQKDWKSHRAVVFLDPFALQVKWETIELIAQTEAIDLWLLFPAMAVNRMLPKSGKIPYKWAKRLDELFGTNDWRETFYEKQPPDLFGEEFITKSFKVFETLSDYVTSRLSCVFAKANKRPLILRNSTSAPIFLLCFASGNPKGSDIAVRIAQHIIDKSPHG